MKKSHRKDVIIARIIFAALVVIVIALIALLIAMISNRNANKKDTQPKATETEYVPNYIEPDTTVTEPTETETETETESEAKTQVWVTKNDINLRKGPNTSSEILTQVKKSDTIYLLSEEPVGDFYRVEFEDQTGYLYKDYVTKENPNP